MRNLTQYLKQQMMFVKQYDKIARLVHIYQLTKFEFFKVSWQRR